MTFSFDPETHTYTVASGAVPSVTQLLLEMGFVDDRFFNDYSRDRGSLVHLIIKWHCGGVLDEETIDPILRPYFDAWLKFEAESHFISKSVEIPLYSEAYGFAGTPDHIGLLNGVRSVIDAKTGVLTPATALQTAGYEILSGERLKRFGLQLTDQGNYKLTEFKDRQDRSIFLAALGCWYWIKNHK